MAKCAVKGLTKRGYLVAQAMKRTRDYDEIMEKEIMKNTDDVIRCFSVSKNGKKVGNEMVNVSKMFPHFSSAKNVDAIQKEIQEALYEAYASLETN